MIGDTHSDGTVVWTEDHLMSIGKLPLVVGYNHSETYQTSGSFTAPVTGLYRITIVGGGGGGGGAGTNARSIHYSGGGGGCGGHYTFYDKLVAGTSYSFTIGAGGTRGTKGSNSALGGVGSAGGTTSITVRDNVYSATGGAGGRGTADMAAYVYGGSGKLNDTYVANTNGLSGLCGLYGTYGIWGGEPPIVYTKPGAGGYGSSIDYNGSYTQDAHDGSNGYIQFEWFDPADAFPALYSSE